MKPIEVFESLHSDLNDAYEKARSSSTEIRPELIEECFCFLGITSINGAMEVTDKGMQQRLKCHMVALGDENALVHMLIVAMKANKEFADAIGKASTISNLERLKEEFGGNLPPELKELLKRLGMKED